MEVEAVDLSRSAGFWKVARVLQDNGKPKRYLQFLVQWQGSEEESWETWRSLQPMGTPMLEYLISRRMTWLIPKDLPRGLSLAAQFTLQLEHETTQKQQELANAIEQNDTARRHPRRCKVERKSINTTCTNLDDFILLHIFSFLGKKSLFQEEVSCPTIPTAVCRPSSSAWRIPFNGWNWVVLGRKTTAT